MKTEHLKKLWLEAEQAAFSGWDFSYLTNRWSGEELPWDYQAIVHAHLNSTKELLDMGTGGGEFLLSLHHPYQKTAVTEGWEPNYQLLLKQLAPLGIDVQAVKDDDQLNFKKEQFDIVLNRHESFEIAEVNRVLKTTGYFVTQQVGYNNNCQLRKFFRPHQRFPFQAVTLEAIVTELTAQGFVVKEQAYYQPTVRFYDVGAFVYFAKVISWEFPDFSVATDFAKLLTLHQQILETGYFDSLEERFLIVAQKIN